MQTACGLGSNPITLEDKTAGGFIQAPGIIFKDMIVIAGDDGLAIGSDEHAGDGFIVLAIHAVTGLDHAFAANACEFDALHPSKLDAALLELMLHPFVARGGDIDVIQAHGRGGAERLG